MKFSIKSLQGAQDFLTIFKKRSGEEYMRPVRDWTIGLVIATSVFVSGVLFIAYDFYTQFGASDTELTVNEEPTIYRDKEVKTFAGIYDAKEKKFNMLRNNQHQAPVTPVEVTGTTTTQVNTEPLAESPTTE